MAINYDIGLTPTSFLADADLSSACVQYRAAATASTAGNVQLALGASSPTPFGVFQSTASAGKPIPVTIFGPTYLTARCTTCILKFGSFLSVASDGVFEAASVTGSPAFAKWLGPQVTSGSANGAGFFYGSLAACALSLT